MPTFDEFLPQFFEIFTQRQFRGADFLTYVQRQHRAGDEAAIVDNSIMSPLLNLLGYAPGEQVYNQNNRNGRPDFSPTIGERGVCFVVEDKSSALELTLDHTNPESHLFQLCGYLRSLGERSGWLTNGRRLMIWDIDNPAAPHCPVDLDVLGAIRDWNSGGRDNLNGTSMLGLRYLWENYRRETYSDWQRLETEIATDLDDWRRRALPLGANIANQETLVGAVKSLLQDLQADARIILDTHLMRYGEYYRQIERLADTEAETASVRLERLRLTVGVELGRLAPLVGLESDEVSAIQNDLRDLYGSPRAFLNTKEIMAKTLATINAARVRKFPGDKKAAKPWLKYDNGLGTLGAALEAFANTAFMWHQQQAILRYDNRASIEVHENYALWTSVVQETMLGGLNETQRRDEFALQAAYAVFIRLMLIRVCEDKGILPNRFLSDGGLKQWQEDIKRYFLFATGNPYDTLLDMAFQNAQNIYAHFFTGRELFNWYSLNRLLFVRVLYHLGRFNFADVDSDLIGTIYNTYVGRPEKRQKGQYYTPSEIVHYILDESGYKTGPAIIGANKRLIDPACGSGSFLVEAARRLVAAYSSFGGGDNPRELIERVRENLYGFDLNPFACYLAEVNLLIQVLDLVKLALDGNNPPRLQRFHIYNVDALAPPSGVLYYARANTLMAEELDMVDRLKGRQGDFETGFAWVVANPPYGAALTDEYKTSLRQWMPEVSYGKPDTYVFFFQLGLHLLGRSGSLGYITPNTYLMGSNTGNLRDRLLQAGRITQIVDLPSGIWKDANVDCALMFLTADSNLDNRKSQQTRVFAMDVRDTLDKLTRRDWKEVLTQAQSGWIDDAQHDINIRWTPLLEKLEVACRVPIVGGTASEVLRLRKVVKTNRGVEPYYSREQGKSGVFIKPQAELKSSERHWKPLLDSSSYVGRYQVRWGESKPYLNYGPWLYRAYAPEFYESTKLIVQSIRNRALRRRLVATYDDKHFFNRHNFSVIIPSDGNFDLKYILALFNSSLLNYWYARHYDNVNVNPSYFGELPIYPADPPTQAQLVALVDNLLVCYAALNALRDQDFVIGNSRGTPVQIPYDRLLTELRTADRNYPVLSLYDARAAGLFVVPDACDPDAQISRVFTPAKSTVIALRANQLWLEAANPKIHRYLLNYLAHPQWKGKSWNEICSTAHIPETEAALDMLFAAEQSARAEIDARLAAIVDADAAIDEIVLDLYGITDPADRLLILGSAPATEDAELLDTSVEDAEAAEVDSGS